MSSESESVLAIQNVSSSETLKLILTNINDQTAQLKNMSITIRNIIKDVDRQAKEIEKLRNKRTRNKAERSANSLPSGITKPVSITDELAVFLDVAPGTLVPRNEVTKKVSDYVKKFALYDHENKQKFVLDSRPEAIVLKTLLGNPTEEVTYFNLQRYLKHHYTSEHPPPSVVKSEPPPVPAVTSTPAVVEEVVKKKTIMVKKKKPTELQEE
jgi:chromatin remodeling complex protein RSC6